MGTNTMWGQPARYATDSAGNVTGISGYLDGFRTVGVNGAFPTIAAAIASVTESEMFVPSTFPNKPANITAWTQGDAYAFVTAFTMSTTSLYDLSDMWFGVDGERKYPIASVSSATPDSVVSMIPRIDADLAASTAFSVYRATHVNILLLDSLHEETLTLSAPFAVNINSLHGTTWRGSTRPANAVEIDTVSAYGHIIVGDKVKMVGGLQTSGAGTPAAIRASFIGGVHHTDMSDLHSFDTCGMVEFIGSEFEQSPVNGLGHFGLTVSLPGDLVIRNSRMTIRGNKYSTTAVNAYPFDSVSARSLAVSGLDVTLDDPEGRVAAISLFGAGVLNGTSQGFNVSGVRMKSKFTSSATVCIVDEMTGGTPDLSADTTKINLADSHIEAANFSGTKKIYRASTGGSGRVVKFQCCSGGDIDTPSVGSRTGTALVV